MAQTFRGTPGDAGVTGDFAAPKPHPHTRWGRLQRRLELSAAGGGRLTFSGRDGRWAGCFETIVASRFNCHLGSSSSSNLASPPSFVIYQGIGYDRQKRPCRRLLCINNASLRHVYAAVNSTLFFISDDCRIAFINVFEGPHSDILPPPATSDPSLSRPWRIPPERSAKLHPHRLLHTDEPPRIRVSCPSSPF